MLIYNQYMQEETARLSYNHAPASLTNTYKEGKSKCKNKCKTKYKCKYKYKAERNGWWEKWDSGHIDIGGADAAYERGLCLAHGEITNKQIIYMVLYVAQIDNVV